MALIILRQLDVGFGSGFRFSLMLSFVLFLSASFRVIVRFNGLGW